MVTDILGRVHGNEKQGLLFRDIGIKGQWRGALMFSLICVWTNGWANNRHADDFRCHGSHYDVTVIWPAKFQSDTIIITPNLWAYGFTISCIKTVVCFMNRGRAVLVRLNAFPRIARETFLQLCTWNGTTGKKSCSRFCLVSKHRVMQFEQNGICVSYSLTW